MREFIRKLKNNSFFLFIIAFLLLYVLFRNDLANIKGAFNNVNYLWILVALIVMGLNIIFRGLGLFYILREYKPRYKLKRALILETITYFFNGITPFSSGGQPMQIYYLKKENFRLAQATNVIIQNFMIYQVALVAYGIIAIFLNYKFNLFSSIPILENLILIGFIINIVILFGLIAISFCHRLTKRFVHKIIRLVGKTGIIKDKKALREFVDSKIEDFYEGSKLLKNNIGLTMKCLILQMLGLSFYYIVPLFVFFSLGSMNVDVLKVLAASAYVMVIGSFVPIPGGSGGIEFGYIQFFGRLIAGNIMSASLIIWRVITYYLPIVVGATIFSFRKDDFR